MKKRGKVESCMRTKDENGRLTLGKYEVQKFWKEYFEDLHNIDTQKQVAVHMRGFDGIGRGNYFGG